MKTLLLPTARKALLSITALLLIHPLSFSQETPSNGSPQTVSAREDIRFQTVSLSTDSGSGWPATRPEIEPVPTAPVMTVEPVQLPRTESHPFWDRQNRALFIAVGSMATADFCVTRSNLANGGRELNPITRVFSGSTAGLATNFALETGSVIGLSYLFHKSGHHKLERLTSYLNLGGSTGSFLYSFTHR